MRKKIITAILCISTIIPLGMVSAFSLTGNTVANITMEPGDAGFASTIDNDVIFETYKYSSNNPNLKSKSTHTFAVQDFSGIHKGWTVTAQFSDFVLDKNLDGVAEDKLSDHSTSINFNCSTTSFKNSVHTCKNDVNIPLASGGTLPIVIVSAPANDTSSGLFNYTIPENFFNLKSKNSMKSGVYTGTLTIEFANVYTP